MGFEKIFFFSTSQMCLWKSLEDVSKNNQVKKKEKPER